MDATLHQLLRALFEYSATIDQLRARVEELENAGKETLALLQEKVAILESDRLPAGWRLTKDS